MPLRWLPRWCMRGRTSAGARLTWSRGPPIPSSFLLSLPQHHIRRYHITSLHSSPGGPRTKNQEPRIRVEARERLVFTLAVAVAVAVLLLSPCVCVHASNRIASTGSLTASWTSLSSFSAAARLGSSPLQLSKKDPCPILSCLMLYTFSIACLRL